MFGQYLDRKIEYLTFEILQSVNYGICLRLA